MNTSPLKPAVDLPEPTGGAADAHQRVRQDPHLGPALERMRSVLEEPGAPGDRLAAFQRTRKDAIEAYQEAAGAGENPLNAEEAASTATGPGPHPALSAFDSACTAALTDWFRILADALVAAEAPREERSEALVELETLARSSMPWSPDQATLAGMGVLTTRLVLEEEP